MDGPMIRCVRHSRAGAATALAGIVASLSLTLAATSAAHAASAAAATAGAGESGGEVPAQWVKRKLRFVYQGFTTHYSCQGLRDQVREVLLQLGARRSDLNVHELGCTRGVGQPEPSPAVSGTFYVLEPAAGSTEQPIKAAWQRVTVTVGTPGADTAGQCELVEQVKQKILPLFSHRNVKFDQRCIPHQLTPLGSTLSAEVLKPSAPLTSGSRG